MIVSYEKSVPALGMYCRITLGILGRNQGKFREETVPVCSFVRGKNGTRSVFFPAGNGRVEIKRVTIMADKIWRNGVYRS